MTRPPSRVSAKRLNSRLEDYAALSVYDVYLTHKAARGIITFRNVDEVMQAIRALEATLPAIERLGRLVS